MSKPRDGYSEIDEEKDPILGGGGGNIANASVGLY